MCKFISVTHYKLLHDPYQEDRFFKTVLFDLLVYSFKSGESAIVSGCRTNAAFGHGAVVKCPTQDWSRRFRAGDFDPSVFS